MSGRPILLTGTSSCVINCYFCWSSVFCGYLKWGRSKLKLIRQTRLYQIHVSLILRGNLESWLHFNNPDKSPQLKLF